MLSIAGAALATEFGRRRGDRRRRVARRLVLELGHLRCDEGCRVARAYLVLELDRRRGDRSSIIAEVARESLEFAEVAREPLEFDHRAAELAAGDQGEAENLELRRPERGSRFARCYNWRHSVEDDFGVARL